MIHIITLMNIRGIISSEKSWSQKDTYHISLHINTNFWTDHGAHTGVKRVWLQKGNTWGLCDEGTIQYFDYSTRYIEPTQVTKLYCTKYIHTNKWKLSEEICTRPEDSINVIILGGIFTQWFCKMPPLGETGSSVYRTWVHCF